MRQEHKDYADPEPARRPVRSWAAWAVAAALWIVLGWLALAILLPKFIPALRPS